MGLFDGKNNNQMPVVSPEVAEIDRQIVFLEQKRFELIQKIGQLYVENNDCHSAAGTIYETSMQELEKMDVEAVNLEKRKLAVQGLRKCEHCGHILELDSVFCNKCGQKLEELFTGTPQNPNVCNKCGKAYADGAVFCTNCGNKLS